MLQLNLLFLKSLSIGVTTLECSICRQIHCGCGSLIFIHILRRKRLRHHLLHIHFYACLIKLLLRRWVHRLIAATWNVSINRMGHHERLLRRLLVHTWLLHLLSFKRLLKGIGCPKALRRHHLILRRRGTMNEIIRQVLVVKISLVNV
jgi:hypothetical protein